MTKYIYLLGLLFLVSCYQETDSVGFLGDNIYLKGADTLYIPIGTKGETDYAWLDNSSMPCTFAIENVKDAKGNRTEQFFTNYAYTIWSKPYNFLTDTNAAIVKAKLVDVEWPCLMVNEVNGQLQYLETSNKWAKIGDIYNIDVRITNSKGTKLLSNYATIKFVKLEQKFVIDEAINGISIVRNGANEFVFYDQINNTRPDFVTRRDNIYANNEKEFVQIHKISDEPKIGIKIIFKMVDSKGNLFDPSKYSTYSSGTYSFIDYAINRKNTAEGMILEFPTTPWPVKTDLLSYLKGSTENNFKMMDRASMRADFNAQKMPSLIAQGNWPADNWDSGTAWFPRFRSKITFYESGTWEIVVKVPYTDIKGNYPTP